MRDRFWERFSLDEMTREEWEALCDGCGKCCLHKLEDEYSGEMFTTRVSCRYLDSDTGRCLSYKQRFEKVSDCINLLDEELSEMHWLPATCAYRLLAEGKPLAEWHPLVSGSADSVHLAGVSVRGRVISEEYVHPDGLVEHIVQWVDE